MFAELRRACLVLLVLTLLTGFVYPLALTGVAQIVFPHQAGGSLIAQGDRIVGSELIGQSFDRPEYFWGRPSATTPMPYNGGSSSGSNLGPTNPALIEAIRSRVAQYRESDPVNRQPIPIDLVTASASGLDPHISPAGALYQISHVAQARGMSADAIRSIVDQHIEQRTLGLLGEPRVNVLKLNLALDRAVER